MGWSGGAGHAEWLKMMLIVLGGGETGPTVPQTISHIQRYDRDQRQEEESPGGAIHHHSSILLPEICPGFGAAF
jgi:hypothetical protein